MLPLCRGMDSWLLHSMTTTLGKLSTKVAAHGAFFTRLLFTNNTTLGYELAHNRQAEILSSQYGYFIFISGVMTRRLISILSFITS
jgi:hypothetical protein